MRSYAKGRHRLVGMLAAVAVVGAVAVTGAAPAAADTSTLTVSNVTVTEGNSGTKLATFTVLRSGSSAGSVSVKYKTADGSAVAPGDYAAKALSGLTFYAGQTTKTVGVAVRGDFVAETNETFLLNLSAPVNATIVDGTGIATILNDDSSAPTTFSVNDVTHTEWDGGTNPASFTITRSGSLAGSASVKYRTADGSAVAPGDYTAKALTAVTFYAGQATKTVAVPVTGDWYVEANETFFLNLSAPVNASIADGTGIATILNDDSSQYPSFALHGPSPVIEGNPFTTKTVTFFITRFGNLEAASSVKYATADGTAVAPGDYTAKALTTLNFAPGQRTGSISVIIRGDKLVEPDETFVLKLSAPVGATISGDGTAIGTIQNDD